MSSLTVTKLANAFSTPFEWHPARGGLWHPIDLRLFVCGDVPWVDPGYQRTAPVEVQELKDSLHAPVVLWVPDHKLVSDPVGRSLVQPHSALMIPLPCVPSSIDACLDMLDLLTGPSLWNFADALCIEIDTLYPHIPNTMKNGWKATTNFIEIFNDKIIGSINPPYSANSLFACLRWTRRIWGLDEGCEGLIPVQKLCPPQSVSAHGRMAAKTTIRAWLTRAAESLPNNDLRVFLPTGLAPISLGSGSDAPGSS